MYSKIVNPKTGRKVSTKGKLGQSILRNYVDSLSNILSGGTVPLPSATPVAHSNSAPLATAVTTPSAMPIAHSNSAPLATAATTPSAMPPHPSISVPLVTAVITPSTSAPIPPPPLSSLIKGFLPIMDTRFGGGPTGTPSHVSWTDLEKIPAFNFITLSVPWINFGDLTITQFTATPDTMSAFTSGTLGLFPWLRQAEQDLKNEMINSGL